MKAATTATVTSTLLAVAIVAIAIMAFYIHVGCSGDGRESGSDKHEWSIMQVIEARNENRSLSDLEFIDHEDYHVVGIPNVRGKATWVMLDPQSPPYYKQFGSDYSLSEEQLQRILHTRHTISTVEECLGSHTQRDR
jgi:hypothetical protein